MVDMYICRRRDIGQVTMLHGRETTKHCGPWISFHSYTLTVSVSFVILWICKVLFNGTFLSQFVYYIFA